MVVQKIHETPNFDSNQGKLSLYKTLQRQFLTSQIRRSVKPSGYERNSTESGERPGVDQHHTYNVEQWILKTAN